MTVQAFPDCNRGGGGQQEVEQEEDVCNNADEASNGYDHDPSSRETTGRWTRDEHLTFIKGLELYGKGWKKIASLIKTRTVVQIRTHAQKYFLKLSKARQSSSSSNNSSCDSSNGFDGRSCQNGIRKRRHRRKKFCRLMSVTPVLHPFIKVSSSSAAAAASCGEVDPSNPTIDADRTLYDFLTPKIGEKTTISMPAVVSDGCAGSSSSSSSAVEDVSNSYSGEDGDRWTTAAAAAADRDNNNNRGGCKGGLQEKESGGSSTTSDGGVGGGVGSGGVGGVGGGVRLVTIEKLTLTADDRQLPEWYSRCEHVSSLLKRADALNWLEDSFTAIPIPEPPIKIINGACTTATTSSTSSSTTTSTTAAATAATTISTTAAAVVKVAVAGIHPKASQATDDSSCRPSRPLLLLQPTVYSSKSSSSLSLSSSLSKRDSRVSDRTDDNDHTNDDTSNGSDSHGDDDESSSSGGSGCTDGETQTKKKRRSGPAASAAASSKMDSSSSCSSSCDDSDSIAGASSSWINPSSSFSRSGSGSSSSAADAVTVASADDAGSPQWTSS